MDSLFDNAFDTVAQKHGLTPERLDKVSTELGLLLSAYDVKEIRAVAELIEQGIPLQGSFRSKGAGR